MSFEWPHLLAFLTGIGLAASCGFRVFLPLLCAAIAVRADVVEVAASFEWLGSNPALIVLAVATIVEIAGYFIPGVDHLLDVIASPSAVVAGSVLGASFLVDVDPWLRWSLGAVAGGAAAGLVQSATVVARSVSGVTSFGLANPLVALGELLSAALTIVLAFVLPLVVLAVVVLATWWWVRRRARRSSEGARLARPSLASG